MRTFGAEEEFLLVDSISGMPRPLAEQLLALDRQCTPDPRFTLTAEVQLQQVESVTQVCGSLAELEAALLAGRTHADSLARRLGARVVALGTSPLPVGAAVTPRPRYCELARRFGLTTREQLTCGYHIHVSINSDDEGVAVLDRIGIWLPALLALSVNSPFWQGQQTGYESYRRSVWTRLPLTGPTPQFGSADRYHREMDRLLSTEVVLDESMVYYDARLSRQYPTVEIRVADVCLDPEAAVLIAALTRALVETVSQEWLDDIPAAPVSTAVRQLATWRASRSGLSDDLLDPRSGRPRPAEAVIDDMLDYLRPSLEESGDERRVHDILHSLLRQGTGAAFQRMTYAASGDLSRVVRAAIARTHAAFERESGLSFARDVPREFSDCRDQWQNIGSDNRMIKPRSRRTDHQTSW